MMSIQRKEAEKLLISMPENANRLTGATGASKMGKTKMPYAIFAALFATVTLLSASSVQTQDVTFNHPKHKG
jgi:hypothetical protein